MTKSIKILERIYFGLLVIILLLIVFNSYFITRSFSRETMTSIVLSLGLFAAAYIVYSLYRREVAKNLEELEVLKQDKLGLEEKISEAFQYIGQLNVQIEEIRSVFSEVKKYPESKSELKYILDFLADKVLATTDIPWICFKVVEPGVSKLLAEHCKTRGNQQGQSTLRHDVNVRQLIDGTLPEGYTCFDSGHTNLDFRVYCLMPKQDLTKEQKMFIKAIMNQLEMFYLIFTSLSLNKNHDGGRVIGSSQGS
ncbi:hypothetical protein HGA34_03995 [Candidatus Falkowbacteria bacterium]|nr:hypothetical protein [Candidatus Falkowbacteria bacterium]